MAAEGSQQRILLSRAQQPERNWALYRRNVLLASSPRNRMRRPDTKAAGRAGAKNLYMKESSQSVAHIRSAKFPTP